MHSERREWGCGGNRTINCSYFLYRDLNMASLLFDILYVTFSDMGWWVSYKLCGLLVGKSTAWSFGIIGALYSGISVQFSNIFYVWGEWWPGSTNITYVSTGVMHYYHIIIYELKISTYNLKSHNGWLWTILKLCHNLYHLFLCGFFFHLLFLEKKMSSLGSFAFELDWFILIDRLTYIVNMMLTV